MKHVLLFVFLVLLLLPGIQKKFSLVKELPLKGVITLSAPDSMTFKNWFSGRFQQTFTTNFNEVIGYKPTLVRLFNQINFSLFNQSNMAGIIVGKSGYLYQDAYINAYTGKDKLNRRDLKKKIGYLYQAQKYLENRSVHFLLVFAPNKARIYPEYLPSRYSSKKKVLTNYEEYLQIIHQDYPDLHFLDINRYFKQLKKTVPYPLYSKGGTHWSNYVLYKYFMDTLIHSMGSLQHKRFPVLTEQNLHWVSDLVQPDFDLRELLNLFRTKFNEKLPYADFKVKMNPMFVKPRLLMISDSYYSMLYGSDLFSRDDFWYYNKTRYPEDYYQGNTDPVFLRDDMLKHDFVILMATEVNIQDFFLFPETTLTLLGLGNTEIKEKESKRQERIRYYIKAIYNNPGWLNNIKGQAQTKHKPLEELIRNNAEYMEKKEHQGKQK